MFVCFLLLLLIGRVLQGRYSPAPPLFTGATVQGKTCWGVVVAAAKMPYVSNGRVVDSKPFSLVDFFLSIVRLVWLFFATLFSSEPVSQHMQEYTSTTRPGLFGGGRSVGRAPRGSNIHGLPKGSLSGGCASG
ncbi:uncharacterized protein Tco025E_02671 [Trypanosoma conorhini]|uniref:Secreted protein n=1 Tax=Trypanosoma conorhini TaxID=83891 RepID=A0A422Q1Y7_9TRYP|nr:uncharacterized protein Tco025E_02671 [Trypanosoma conorhini]RNF23967.1 hypothetical protein Tco025E_02671 [Trypanosoma conorhini]